jgi:hypothetical protein
LKLSHFDTTLIKTFINDHHQLTQMSFALTPEDASAQASAQGTWREH